MRLTSFSGHLSILIVILNKLGPRLTLFFLQLAEGFALHRFQNIKRAAQGLVHVQDTRVVVEFSAVVGCGENCYQAAIGHEFVAIFDDLMGTADQAELMSSIELSDYILPKYKAHTPIIISPTLDIKLRIRPEQIAKQSSIWHILWPCLLVNALKVVQVGTEAAVHTQDTIIYDC